MKGKGLLEQSDLRNKKLPKLKDLDLHSNLSEYEKIKISLD
jgi:hypothetical protein